MQSNDEDMIKETTSSAFALLPSSPASKDVLAAFKVLNKLKGVGPATASLLLSVANPESVPFFSDELFRWYMWDEPGSPEGWKRGIKYSVKEYEALFARVEELRKRLNIRAVDAEKVAWVLGKESVNVDADNEEEGDSTPPEKSVEKEDEGEKRGAKRKANDSKAPKEGTRKSARTKK